MRTQLLWVLPVALLPAIAASQGTPMRGMPMPGAPMQGMRGAQMSASFERMKTNVAKITAPAERERWDANVALWQIASRMPPMLEKADYDNMQASVNKISTNIAKLSASAEKERWEANRNLWLSFLAGSSADTTKANATFATLSKNVAKISEPAEKERWQANKDLWQMELMRLNMRRGMMSR